MSVIWLDEPPYVMRSSCPACFPDCAECTLCDCCCLCQDCYDVRREMEDER